VQVRSANVSDREWLFALHEEAHKALVEEAYGPWVQPEQRTMFDELLEEHDGFVVERAGTPVGAYYLGVLEDDVWLELIEVLPDHQGAGVGSAGLAQIRRYADQQGRGVQLQVHKLNEAARRLYEREGFIPNGATATHHLMRWPSAPSSLPAGAGHHLT
jgi:GNAT superfamily N-acetyltransferase